MRILIVGYGFVGTATKYLFKEKVTTYIHDPAIGYTYDRDDSLDYIFLCVPTELNPYDGRLDTGILTQAYNQWRSRGNIVIRSTIGPDQVELFPDAIMMPEFLREAHWKEDVDDPLLPVIASDYSFVHKLQTMLPNKKCWYLRPKEAMMYKLARNSALAMKVSLANHFFEICKENKIDYNTVMYMLKNDTGLGSTHWQVPGPDGQYGFGGKCLPKDLTHMASLCYTKDNIMEVALGDNLMRRIRGEINELN